MKLGMILSACVCTFTLTTLSANPIQPAPAINKILVFGDSLSDSGNIYQLTYSGQNITKYIKTLTNYYPDGIIPAKYNEPYYGGRFSNGKLWVEDLANFFGIRDTNIHRYASFENYAYGGAWSSLLNTDSKIPAVNFFPPSIEMQVDGYALEHTTKTVQPNTLAIFMIGANDYLNDRKDIDKATTNSVNAQMAAIKNLYAHGIRHFLVAGLPDLSKTAQAYVRDQKYKDDEY